MPRLIAKTRFRKPGVPRHLWGCAVVRLLTSDLDEQTRDYLKHFAGQAPDRSRKTLRQIAQAVIFTRRPRCVCAFFSAGVSEF